MDRNIFFHKEDTNFVKGIAIILMVALHRLKPEWIINPQLLIDFSIRGTPLYAIIARSGDVCIGIFAFITGYGWYNLFHRKTQLERILSLKSGIYPKYWLSLLLICFPARVLCGHLLEGTAFTTNVKEIILSTLAIESKSSPYCWYVSFFALVVLTYPLLLKIISKPNNRPVILIAAVLITSFAVRVADKMFLSKIPFLGSISGVITHYIQWIPAIALGSVCAKYSIFEKTRNWSEKNLKINPDTVGILMVASLYFSKTMIQFLSGIYTNLDCIIIIPMVYGLICLSHRMRKRLHGYVFNVISFLGDLSFYIWMVHSILKYTLFQKIIYSVRIPILVLIGSICVTIPFCILLKKIDQFISKRFSTSV